jgi:hypothetical protein
LVFNNRSYSLVSNPKIPSVGLYGPTMNWKFDFSPETSDILAAFGDCRRDSSFGRFRVEFEVEAGAWRRGRIFLPSMTGNEAVKMLANIPLI